MYFDENRTKANAVLAVFQDLVANDCNFENIRVSVSSYQNGREQGAALIFYSLATTKLLWFGIAEHRRSDSIIIYISDIDPMQALGDNENVYHNGKMFDSEDYVGAAKFIMNKILEAEKADEKELAGT